MTHDEMIAVLAAHRDGRKIQFRPFAWGMWEDYEQIGPPSFSGSYEYRIKPNLVCKTTATCCGYSIYVEGGPSIARRLEASVECLYTNRDLAKYDDDSPREKFELKPV